MKNKNGFIKGAAILSIGGIIAKVAGALYRIPLTNLLGTEGMGLYHLIFPFYTLLLAASSAGIPVALSRLIAEKIRLNDYKGAEKVFITAFTSLSLAGILFASMLYFNAERIASFQGNINAAAGYRMISPAVLFVAQISVLRGYFQGRMSMVPTAFSQIIEQGAKIAFTMAVAITFLPDVVRAVSYSILGVSVSEFVALIILIAIYKGGKKRRNMYTLQNPNIIETSSLKTVFIIFAVALPITIGSIIFPLSHIVDSVLVYRIMGGYFNGNVTSMYGILNGPVHSLTGFPVVIAAGVAMAAVPAISSARIANDREGIKKKIEFALKLTFLIAVPGALGLLIFSDRIIRLLYGNFTAEEINTASLLLKISSLSVLFISVMQTSVSVLAALKRSVITTFNLIIAVLLKVALSIILLRNPALNIYGLAIAAVVCYMVAAMLNYFYILKTAKININGYAVIVKPLICAAVTVLFSYGAFELLKMFTTEDLALLFSVISALPVFVITAIKLEVFTEYEVKYIPVIKKLKSEPR